MRDWNISENGIKQASAAAPAPAKPPVEREEPEKIKKWREEQRKRLEEKGWVFVFIGVFALKCYC